MAGLVGFGGSGLTVRADESLAGKAARSVHLAYPGPAATAFYNEMTIQQSVEGSYFCACGFSGGYFGLQEQSRGRKVAIFSIWDPGRQNDPDAVANEQRVKTVVQGEGVRIGRFGGEGTGGQSFLNVDWKVGETYRFLVQIQPDVNLPGNRSIYSAHLGYPDGTWKHIASFSTPDKRHTLTGFYSFVEDFRRDRKSLQQTRSAAYGMGAALVGGSWQTLSQARFTADSNPATNIDALIENDRFVLQTGGQVENTHAKLRDLLSILDVVAQPPAELPSPLTKVSLLQATTETQPMTPATGPGPANQDSPRVDPAREVLRHVVIYQFKPDLTPEQLGEVIDTFTKLPEQIDTIIGFEKGVNVSPERKSEGLTHVFVVTFRNEADRDAYLTHPAHLHYVNVAKDKRDKVVVFDYWTPLPRRNRTRSE